MMENPEVIEIHGLPTIHKLCKFGADLGMDGCSFTEIIERMFDELSVASAVPDGFVLVPKDQIISFWKCTDGSEIFCSSESNFDHLGRGMDLGDIVEINKHTQAHIKTEKLYGTWIADFGNPDDLSKFFVGTKGECEAVVLKNEDAFEASENKES